MARPNDALPSGELPPPVERLLEDLPGSRLGGYDRDATRRLFARMSDKCGKLFNEWRALEEELANLRAVHSDLSQDRERLAGELSKNADELVRVRGEFERDREQLATWLEQARAGLAGQQEDGRRREDELRAKLRDLQAELSGLRQRRTTR